MIQNKINLNQVKNENTQQFFSGPMPLKNITCLIFLVVVMLNISGCGRCDKSGDDSCQIQSESPDTINNDNGSGSGDDSGNGRNDDDNGGGDNSRTITEQLLDHELITDSIYLGIVQPDDVLHFEIEGVETVPQFSAIYERSYASSWKVFFCPLIDPPVRDFPRPPFPPIPPRPDFKRGTCHYITVPGNCRHKFRNRIADKVEQVVIKDDLKKLKLKLVIGDKDFPLGEVVERKENKVFSKLLLTREMLTQEREAKLIVQKYDAHNVKVGFIGFGSCNGLGSRDFKTTGPTNSSNLTVRAMQEFTVSASVEYIENER